MVGAHNEHSAPTGPVQRENVLRKYCAQSGRILSNTVRKENEDAPQAKYLKSLLWMCTGGGIGGMSRDMAGYRGMNRRISRLRRFGLVFLLAQ
jgi:hypothetical protein